MATGLVVVLDCVLPVGVLRASDPDELVSRPVIEIVTTRAKGRDRLRVEALVTSESIQRVDFLLDGELVGRDLRFPFGAVIAAADPLAPALGSRLEGVAFDREGREVARDSLALDRGRDEVSLSLAPVLPVERGAWLEIAAEVRHPPDVAIERVDFYRNDRYVASSGTAPYRVRIAGVEDGDYLRAVALTRDGGIVEAVHLLAAAGEDERVSVSLVEVYAMVTTRSGAPVSGLGAESFSITQAGLQRPIERFVEGDSVPLSLALVIDGSGSMFANLERAKRSARDFLTAALDEGDRALLVDFDSRPRLLHDSTDDVESLISRFDGIRSRGGSAIYDAILFAALRLEAVEGRRALVVLTDGQDSGSRISPPDCALAARRSGVPIFVLNLGSTYGAAPSHHSLALQKLATTSGGSFHEIRQVADIPAAYEAIETQLRGQYLLGFSSDAPLSSAELDSLSLRVSDKRLSVRTILGGQVRVMN